MTTTQYDSCKLCQGGGLRTVYHSRRNGFPIAHCLHCGLFFVNRVFSKGEQSAIYQDETGFTGFVDAERRVSGAQERRREQSKQLMQHMPAEAVGKDGRKRPLLLDVGCGSGDFLIVARQEGFDVRGQDISAPAARLAEQCHGLRIENGEIETYHPPKLFDAVTLLGVLEHVLDPKNLLTHLYRLLTPGGVLLVYTPVWGLYDKVFSFVARANGGRFTRLIDRRMNRWHLQIFPRKTLVHVLEGLGMTILACEEICEYNLPVDRYLESIGINQAGLQKAVARVVQDLIDRRLFFRNNMLVFARKCRAQ